MSEQPKVQRIVDKDGLLLYERGKYNVNDPSTVPEMSVTAHSPSASVVAEYCNTMMRGLDSEIVYDKRIEIAQEMTAIWLKGQMKAVVELTRQSDDGPFRLALEGTAPIQLYEGGNPFKSGKIDAP